MSPSHIFFVILERIDERLRSAGRPRTLHDRKQASQLRADFFQLQAWARVHRKWPDAREAKKFSKLRDQSKVIEDVLGRVDMANVLLDEASKENLHPLVRFLSDELHDWEQMMKSVLRESRWMVKKGKPRSSKLAEELKAVDWPTSNVHVDYLRADLAREMSAFSKRFDKEIRPVLMRKKYDHDAIEFYVHEWRRQIRWYAIYLQTARGLFGLSAIPKKLTHDERELIDEMKGNPFAKLPTDVKPKVKIDAVGYLSLTRLIDRIGKVKEEAEKFFFMKEKLLASGMARTEREADARARKLYGDVPDEAPAKIRALVEEYDAFRPVDRIRRDLTTVRRS